MVARELRSGRELRAVGRRAPAPGRPAVPTSGRTALFVAYYASAELGCFLALGWPMPARILDLFAEFRVATNGARPARAARACSARCAVARPRRAWPPTRRREMRALAHAGRTLHRRRAAALLAYCAADVDALARSCRACCRRLLGRQRGRHASRSATPCCGAATWRRRPAWSGPASRSTAELLGRIRGGWTGIKAALVAEVDAASASTTALSFRAERFAAYLAAHGIPWPRLASGALALDDDTFRDMAKAYPQLQPLRELRHALGELRLEAPGGRARTAATAACSRAFRRRTGRNQPSNTRFVFGPATWVRSLIRPEPGPGARLRRLHARRRWGSPPRSRGDPALLEAYRTGDIYLALRQAGRAGAARTRPRRATASCATAARRWCWARSTAWGRRRWRGGSAARRARPASCCGCTGRPTRASGAGPTGTVASAVLTGRIETVFGWRLHVGAEFNPRSLMNFPMQANGAEMLRLACCLATERGIAVCAPVHDALLIEAPAGRDRGCVWRSCRRACARRAGSCSAASSWAATPRWCAGRSATADKRGAVMWETVTGLVAHSVARRQ